MPDVGLIPNNTAQMMQGLGAPQGANGALGQIQQYQGIMGTMMQQQGAAQELQARSAMGPLAQASIDPQTGAMDYGKFSTLIASDPRTAWKAPDIINSIVQRQLTQAQTIKTSLESGIEAQKLIGNELASLVPKGDLVTKDDVAGAIARIRGTDAGQMLFPSDAAAMKFIQNMPKSGAPLAQWVRQGALRGAAAQNNMEQVFGKMGFANIGGAQVPYTQQLSGQTTYGNGIANTPTTEQLNRPQETVDAQGNTHVAPAATVMPMVNGAGAPVTSPGGGGGAPTQPSPGAPGGGTGSPSPVSPPTTKLGPGQQKLLETQWAGAPDFQKGLNQAATAATNVLALADEAQDALKGVQTGGGGNVRREIGSALQALKTAGFPGITQTDIDKVASGGAGDLGASEVFRKIMQQLSSQIQMESLRSGGHFSERVFENFQAANPNLDTDPRAVQKMLGFVTKMARLNLEEQSHYGTYVQRAQQTGDPSYSLQDFQTRWGRYLKNSGVLSAKDPGP